MSQTIGTPDGNYTLAVVVAGTTPTLAFTPTRDTQSVTFVNADQSQVVDVGASSVAVGTGVPLQTSGGRAVWNFRGNSPGTTLTPFYLVSPSGGASVRVISKP